MVGLLIVVIFENVLCICVVIGFIYVVIWELSFMNGDVMSVVCVVR